MTTQKNSQNDQLYATKKKDFVTKRLRAQLASSQWQHQSPSNKWLTHYTSVIFCRSRSQGYWEY